MASWRPLALLTIVIEVVIICLAPSSAQTRAISFLSPDRIGYYDRGKPVACIGFIDDRYEPGKTVWGWNNCNVPWGNTFIETRDYYIVRGGRWIKAEGGIIPKGAFNAASKGDPMFICTARIYGGPPEKHQIFCAAMDLSSFCR